MDTVSANGANRRAVTFSRTQRVLDQRSIRFDSRRHERRVAARRSNASISGEVRFDRVSRALYATDASVYQIEPLGVVVPRTREDVVAAVDIARAARRPITARGGGTSQAGQAIGAGIVARHVEALQPRPRAECRRALGMGRARRRARRAERAAAHAGLRFAPDISTASRATIGGMIANNSSGARSVVYGKTIDHVLELQVVLADGCDAHLRAARRRGARRGVRRRLRSRPPAIATVRDVAAASREEIERRFPKVLRRVGGYNLDEFVDPAKPFNLAKMIVGSEGTLALVTAAKINLVPLPAAKAVLDD